MSIDTVIRAGLTRPTRPLASLVLMGGGARTAYQVGVLRALAAMLGQQDQAHKTFPFKILLGTSAGALNAAYLAGCAGHGLDACLSNRPGSGTVCGLPLCIGWTCIRWRRPAGGSRP